MTGFRIDQGGIFGMRTGAAAKTEGSNWLCEHIKRDQASQENVPTSNP